MQINFVHIQNFRKLKNCRIDISEKETVFVGANNSGKTSAMDALILFFKSKNKFNTKDFTLTNWKDINVIGEKWLNEKDITKIDLTVKNWELQLPTLDIWLKVENNELHHVSHLIPTLDWKGGLLGVRLRYEPSNIENLYKEFTTTCNNSNEIINGIDVKKGQSSFKLWPKDMWDFLERDSKLGTHFTVRTYLLNPDLKDTPQSLTEFDIPIEGDVLSKLIKVDIINAQRGFSDANSELAEGGNGKNLSTQLRSYYDKHLSPSVNPTKDDIEALKLIHNAKETFDKNLKESFKTALGELELLNYPGFGNPKINLSSKINTVDSLQHDSSVQYLLDDGNSDLSLPEKYNGLGYQNLISMIFKLIRFRDEWMKVGKSLNMSETVFEPLHLVLVEEPEAHLHVQVQQVFIKEAYKVLRKHPELGDKKNFTTQLLISTHSSHVAHEILFTSLRYFKRQIISSGKINTSKVVNLSKTFGNEDETTKFAIRYLKTTHCDLFFADAVIMVEGPAERMLIPYFIKHHTKLTNCYLSILEIGGSHAHRLRSLVENLEIICLVISDIDSTDPKNKNKKVRPEKNKGYNTGNDTLKSWIPNEGDLDKLLAFSEFDKIDKNLPIKVAYQMPITINNGKTDVIVNPYTFEDSLVMENRQIFQGLTNGTGLLKEMIDASKESDIEKSAQAMYDCITQTGAKKAEFALELFYFEEPNKLLTPKYIKEGLEWLESKLLSQKTGLTNS